MRRSTVVLVAFVVLAAGLPAQATEDRRAMCLWEGPSAEVLQFSLDRGIDRLFLSAPPGFSSNDGYRTFLDSAEGAGLEVFALAGDPSWAQQSRRSTPFGNGVDEVVDFGGFDGLAPDVEPYLHPAAYVFDQGECRSVEHPTPRAFRVASPLTSDAAVLRL